MYRRIERQVLVVGMLSILILALMACGGGGGSAQQEEKKANKVHHIPEDSQ